MKTRPFVGIVLLAFLLLPRESRSQEISSSLEELRAAGLLKRGEPVFVTDADGRRTKARFVEIGSNALTLRVGDDARTLDAINIVKIERRDSIENGIWIGLGIAGGITTAWCKAEHDEACPYIVAYFGLPAMGAGAAIGGIVDAAVRRTLFLAPAGNKSPGVGISPVLSNTHKGLMLSLAF